MDANSDSVTQNRPFAVNRRHIGETSVSEVFGFPLAVNQYSTLEANQTAEFQISEQEEENAARFLHWRGWTPECPRLILCGLKGDNTTIKAPTDQEQDREQLTSDGVRRRVSFCA